MVLSMALNFSNIEQGGLIRDLLYVPICVFIEVRGPRSASVDRTSG
jgi:hypothetical protein